MGPPKNDPPQGIVVGHRHIIAAVAIAAGGNSVPSLVQSQHRGHVIEQLEQIRSELAASRIETARSLAECIQELRDHGRRLESLENRSSNR